MNHKRDAQHLGRNSHRQAHIAALQKHHIGPKRTQNAHRLTHALDRSQRIAGIRAEGTEIKYLGKTRIKMITSKLTRQNRREC